MDLKAMQPVIEKLDDVLRIESDIINDNMPFIREHPYTVNNKQYYAVIKPLDIGSVKYKGKDLRAYKTNFSVEVYDAANGNKVNPTTMGKFNPNNPYFPVIKLLTTLGFITALPKGGNDVILGVPYANLTTTLRKLMNDRLLNELAKLSNPDTITEVNMDIAEAVTSPSTDPLVKEEMTKLSDPVTNALLLAIKTSIDTNSISLQGIRDILAKSTDNVSGLMQLLNGVRNTSDMAQLQEILNKIPGFNKVAREIGITEGIKGNIPLDQFTKLIEATSPVYSTDTNYVIDKNKRIPVVERRPRRLIR